MTIQQDPETGQSGTATTRTVRATSSGSRATGGAAATITAELPVVQGSAGNTVRRAPGVNAVRRQSAPVALRISVWLLALVLLIVAVGAIIADAKPNDLSVLRHTANPVPVATSNTSSNTTTSTPTFHQVSATATAVTYAVPASAYSLVITVSDPTFIEGHSPATASSWAFARTIGPGKPTTIAITGSTTLELLKTPVSVSITSKNKVLGSIAHPKSGVTYTFDPSSAAG